MSDPTRPTSPPNTAESKPEETSGKPKRRVVRSQELMLALLSEDPDVGFDEDFEPSDWEDDLPY